MEHPTIYESFGLRLARLRQERGLSQRELAEALAVTRQAVSNWERGQTVPDLGMLARLCQVLEVDWNRLCGETAPPEHRPSRRAGILVPAGAAVVLALACTLLLWPGSPPRTEPSQTETPPYGGLRGEVLRSHLVTAVEAGPNGLQKQAAGQLAEALEALTGIGEIEMTGELRQSFDLAGDACEFRYLPAYEDGVFADRDQVLTWLYRGLFWRGAPTVEGVDQQLAAWFGPELSWTHGSTEHYTLTEEGWYRPDSAYSGSCAYGLESLERGEDGRFRVRLRLEETDGNGEVLPERVLDLELAAEGRQLRFFSVVWSEG